jgi:ubiquinone/menaquinone biosynthesis C-methylase UbiE
LLKDLRVDDLNAIDVLDVGIGNGYADCLILEHLNRFIGVDTSAGALEYAKKKLPQMIGYVNDAEDLDAIANASVDVYLSFRTFQSSLFDRRAALHEAHRVLRKGGLIILSIPIMFLKDDGSVLSGLIPPGSFEPEMDYAKEIVGRVRHLLKTLNFKDVGMDDRSPFEVYVYAHR